MYSLSTVYYNGFHNYTYATGRPYTERIWTVNAQRFEGEIRLSKGAWQEADQLNNKRYPDYHRLDIAFNSRFYFKTWSIAIFLSVQNIYNRKNIAGFQYNSDATIATIYQFSLLPVLGLDIRF